MEQPSELFSLHLEPITQSYLSEAARWAKFLAIMGFILCGFIALMGLFAGSIIGFMSRSSGEVGGGGFGSVPTAGIGAAAGLIYVLLALLYFLPCLYLFRFSNKMKIALASSSQQDLNTSFQNLKSLFKFVGILTIIVLAFYVLAIVFFVVIGASQFR